MGHLHVQVVDDHGKVVDGNAVGLDDDHIAAPRSAVLMLISPLIASCQSTTRGSSMRKRMDGILPAASKACLFSGARWRQPRLS